MPEQIIGVIPARYASTRFPGKPLAMLGGKPMIQWVYERAAAVLPRVIAATDDRRILKTVEGFGGEAMLTSDRHRTGTERCAEVLERVKGDAGNRVTLAVNIQGDEPLLERTHLEELINCMKVPGTSIGTLVRPSNDVTGFSDPNVVKAVLDQNQRALYFSRAPIPYPRNQADPKSGNGFHLVHLGLYAFRTEVLREIVRLRETPLEKAESLEQLRWLEHGYTIRAGITRIPSTGVDTPADLDRVRSLIEQGSPHS